MLQRTIYRMCGRMGISAECKIMIDVYACVCVSSSISEEEPGPLRSDTEGKNVTKVSRTFSYLKNKMYKKTRVREHGDLNSPVCDAVIQ